MQLNTLTATENDLFW